MSGARIDAIGLVKRFGAVTALDGAELTAEPGRVTCLLGDNGAGKSTLIGILSGALRPDAGVVTLDGRPIAPGSPREARALGIQTVYQDLATIPLLSVWRNFFMGAEPLTGRGPLQRIDVKRCREVAREQLAQIGVEVADPDRPVGTLSGGQRQALAIARAAWAGGRVLILDEPTAALGVRQAAIVLERVRRARDEGRTVILVTHNPAHAAQVGDAFVILHQGRVAAVERAGASAERLAALMGTSRWERRGGDG